ncbi:MAG: pyruvate phosphate dikinase PEP/pyruvate-binding protein [Gemmatimonadetes bacterium]|nr:pyruvate phosphate dikinase PEP/pyruvate-binding protein [Gemmatimonadota bacterium]
MDGADVSTTRWIVGAGDGLPSPLTVGGKAYGLARIERVGLPVPAWITIAVDAFDELVFRGYRGSIDETQAEEMRARAVSADLPDAFAEALRRAMDAAGMDVGVVAVRSSAVGEDGAAASYAGQFASVLGVSAVDEAALHGAIRRVWASAFSPHALAYASARGMDAPRMAVVVQRMADAAVSGVAFSVDPVTGAADTVVVSAVYGLGEALVSGDADADTFHVRAPGGVPGAVARTVAAKDSAVRLAAGGGTETVRVPEPFRRLPALNDAEAREVASAAIRLQFALGRPQDVEWALVPAEGGDAREDRWIPGRRRLVILQSRPITTLPSANPSAPAGPRIGRGSSSDTRTSRIASPESHTRADLPASPDAASPITLSPSPDPSTEAPVAAGASDDGSAPSNVDGGQAVAASVDGARGEVSAAIEARGERRVWDNSNIAESYGGVTTPLTFSFARAAYEDVYLQFCRVMGVEEALLAERREVFANMLGLVRGRVYYNLLNWYRALALLPGYAFNRPFMERMMGVRERLSDPPAPPTAAERRRDLLRLLRGIVGLVRQHGALRHEVPAFHARVAAALAPVEDADLDALAPDELRALYARLENGLLRHWRAPLVNDFFAMVWFGVLGRLVERWLPAAPTSLANDLLCGEGGIVSAEPARWMAGLARTVREDDDLRSLFADERDDAALWMRVSTEPRFAAFHDGMRAYLRRFGDRCHDELKLETITPRLHPASLIPTLRAYVAMAAPVPPNTPEESPVRLAAEARVRSEVRAWRRGVFGFVLRRTRERVRDRENLRFERTRVFGIVRRIFTALGRQFSDMGRLDDPRDIFYLTRDEIFAEIDGTAVSGDPRALVSVRRAAWDAWAAQPAPPDRFETFGPVAWDAAAASADVPADGIRLGADGVLQGLACCAGVVRAEVRVVRDPRRPGELAGRILVAERTDPGWTLLFPLAAGILVERGSLLSHAAIVAREIGAPCIVSVGGLLAALRDGDVVEMDGATGEVRRICAAEA